jgi:hypothetical protein
MQISKKVPFDDPNVLNGVRALYVLSNIIIASIYFYVQQQINKKNGASSEKCDTRSNKTPAGWTHNPYANKSSRHDSSQVRRACAHGVW